MIIDFIIWLMMFVFIYLGSVLVLSSLVLTLSNSQLARLSESLSSSMNQISPATYNKCRCKDLFKILAAISPTAIGTQFIFYSYIVLLEYQLPRPAVGKGYISNPHGIHLDLKENRFRFPKLRQSNPIYFSDRYCQRFLLSFEIQGGNLKRFRVFSLCGGARIFSCFAL